MEFKVGSLLNLISGKSDSKASAEEKIVFKQKPKAASTSSVGPAKRNKSFKDKKFNQTNDQPRLQPESSMLKSSSLRSSLNLHGKFKRGTLNKSFKQMKNEQSNKPEIPENSSQAVVGKSFKYINSESISNLDHDSTDGNTNDKCIDEDVEKLSRTVFVGNLPLTKISENAIRKLFSPFGEIESFRIRSVPLKDMRVSKKVAAIKSDFHPGRTNTNAYVVMKDKQAAEAALSLNGTILENHHLRVDKAESSEENDPRKAIFIGNVSFKAEEDDLWTLFEQCGDIDHVRILRDKETSVSKGAAYVNFRSADSVELALQMEGTAEIHGRQLKIHRCLPGRRKSFHAVSSRQGGPRNTDDTVDMKTRVKEESRFQKKMKRREKREAQNAENEAKGLRSRPLKDPSTLTVADNAASGKSFVGVKADNQQKRKRKRLDKGLVQRIKVAKILTNVKPEVKRQEPSKVVEMDDEQPTSSAQNSFQDNTQENRISSTNNSSKVTKKSVSKNKAKARGPLKGNNWRYFSKSPK